MVNQLPLACSWDPFPDEELVHVLLIIEEVTLGIQIAFISFMHSSVCGSRPKCHTRSIIIFLCVYLCMQIYEVFILLHHLKIIKLCSCKFYMLICVFVSSFRNL